MIRNKYDLEKFIFGFFLLMFFCVFCERKNKIDYNKMQGNYEYLLIDSNSSNIIDTLYSTVRILNKKSNDTLKIETDIMGEIFGTNNKILKLWDIVEKKDRYAAKYYTVYSLGLNAGDNWKIDEGEFESGTFEVLFACLSTDTVISVNSENINNITLIEQKNWIDAGGFWEVMQYGIENKTHKVVYVSKFFKDQNDSLLVEKHNFLILNRFIHKDKWPWPGYKEWITKNSLNSKKWFYNYDEFKDDPSPPESPK